ncbi:hypothetical protein CsSME_00044705 [Camellia sinensis var. sinensis]
MFIMEEHKASSYLAQLLRLPAKPLLTFKLVSKSWPSLLLPVLSGSTSIAGLLSFFPSATVVNQTPAWTPPHCARGGITSEQVGHEFINLRPSRDVAVLDFSYKFGTHVNVKLRLPAVFNKFLQPVTVSAEEFFPQWRSLAGPTFETSRSG